MRSNQSYLTLLVVFAVLVINTSYGLRQQQTIGTSTSLDVRLAEDYEANIPKSRKKRSVIFPTGSDLSFNVGLSIPISALSATSIKLFSAI